MNLINSKLCNLLDRDDSEGYVQRHNTDTQENDRHHLPSYEEIDKYITVSQAACNHPPSYEVATLYM